MKKLFYLIFMIGCLLPSLAQVGKPNQAKTEIEQEIKDLKKDIQELEAEIKSADPAEAAELKTELAALKKMLAMLQKPTPTVPARQTTNPSSFPVAKYRSPIEPVVLTTPVTVPTLAQAKGGLLWYRGKKIDDSTLVTTYGMVVQYRKKKDKVVLQPEKKSDLFEKMIEELSKSDIRKEQLIAKFSKMKNGFLYYPDIERTLTQFNEQTEAFNDVVKNAVFLPPLPGQENIKTFAKEKNDQMPGNDNPNSELIKKIYNEAKKQLDALPPVGDFPAPPEKDLTNCSWCDSSIRKREKIEDSTWVEKFSGPESEITAKVLGVYRQAALLGIEDFGEKNNSTFDPVLDSLNNRIAKKIKLLWERYGKQMKRFEIVVRTVLAYERQKALLGFDDKPGDVSVFTVMGNLDSIYKAYFKEQVDLKNHNFVLNFPMHITLERQKALLGIQSEPGEDGFGEVFSMAKKYNRFGMTIDLDFIYEQRDDDNELELKATGKIGNKTKTYAMLKIEGCSYKVLHYNEDYSNINENKAAIPLFVESGEKTIRDEEDKLVTYTYSGPREMKLQFPEFKIDFCESGKSDTAFMMPLNFAVGDQMAISNTGKSYKAEMLPLANHIFINETEMENNLTKGMELAAEIMAGMEEPDDSPSTGDPDLDKLKVKYNLKIKQDNYKKKISEMSMNEKAVFLFQANNRATVLIDKFNDSKHEIDDNRKMVKGLIHVKVVHEPAQ